MFKILTLAFLLSLTCLMTLPGTFPAVRAVNQNSPTRFSPFGPFTQQLIIHYYSDFGVMFQHFQAGEIDVSDWQLQSQNDVNTFCSNPDFYCTTAQEELSNFGFDIQSRTPFMGIPLQENRTTTPPSFVTGSTVPGCTTGFGSLSIILRNQETGSNVLDSLNTVTISNQPSGTPSATVNDSGGSVPRGVYDIPCILAGNYSIRSSVYNASGSSVVVQSATSTSGTLNVNWNSQSLVRPTQARAFLGASISHLLDDPEFVNSLFGPVAEAPCAFGTKTQGLTCPTQAQIDNAECELGNHPWLNIVGCISGATGHDTSAYNIADDKISAGAEWWNTGGTIANARQGYSGHDDLRAACDDFVSMGLVLSSSTATCDDVANAAAGTTDPGNYPHIVPAGSGHIVVFIRVNFGRQQSGQILADTLDFLFGTPMDRAFQTGFVGVVCYSGCPQYTPKYFTFTQEIPCIFEDTAIPIVQQGCGEGPWQLHTGAQGFDPTPDQFFINRNSINTGGVCAGTGGAVKPNNYVFWCDPQTDTDSAAGEFAPSLGLSNQFFQRELVNELNKAVQVSGFDFIDAFVENNGWNFQQCTSTCVPTQSSLVNAVGFGTQAGSAFFSLLNARQVPGYIAHSAAFQPVPGTIRRGYSQDTTNLSPFTFNSVWEGDFLTQVFDTMLNANPNTGGSASQFIDWGTISHSASFNPNEVGCNSINGCVGGVTTQIWHLRNDWKFSDGNDVKATDVAYTIIANRDVPSSLLQSFVLGVVSATGLDCGPGQACKTLQVKIQGQSALNEFNVGATQLVIEKALWVPFCGDPPIVGGFCASPTFDPMYPSANSPGIEVGSGPWSCIAPISGRGVTAGHIGGPCSRDASGALTGGAITRDGTIFLSENTNFDRCCPNGPTATSSSLYKLSYSDHNNNGVVDILDLADVASHVGTPDPYWCNPNIACMGGVVGIINLATVALYFGHGVTYPYTPSTLTLVDPQIDPFFCADTGCGPPILVT